VLATCAPLSSICGSICGEPLTSPVRHAVEVASEREESEREAGEREASAPSSLSQGAGTYLAHQVISHHMAHQVIVVTDRQVYEQLKAAAAAAAGAEHGPVLEPRGDGGGGVEWAEGGLEVFRALTAASAYGPGVEDARRAHDDGVSGVGPESCPEAGAAEASTELVTPVTLVDLGDTHKLVSPVRDEAVQDEDGQAEQSRARDARCRRLDAGALWQAEDEKDVGLCRLVAGQDMRHTRLQAPAVAHEHGAVAHEHRAAHEHSCDREHRPPLVAQPPASDRQNDERGNDEQRAGGAVRRAGDVRFFQAPAPVLFGDGLLAGSREEDVAFDADQEVREVGFDGGCSRDSALKTVWVRSESLPAVLQILGSPRRGIGAWHGIGPSPSHTARHADSGADSDGSKTSRARGSFTITHPQAVAPGGLTRGGSTGRSIRSLGSLMGGIVQLQLDGLMQIAEGHVVQIAQGQAVPTPPSTPPSPPVSPVPAASRKHSAVSAQTPEGLGVSRQMKRVSERQPESQLRLQRKPTWEEGLREREPHQREREPHHLVAGSAHEEPGGGGRVGGGEGELRGEWGSVVGPWQHREMTYVGVSAKTGRPLARSGMY